MPYDVVVGEHPGGGGARRLRRRQGLGDDLTQFVRVPRRLQILEVERLAEFVGPGVQGAAGVRDPCLGDGGAGRAVGVEDAAPLAVDLVDLVTVVVGVAARRHAVQSQFADRFEIADVAQRLGEVLGEGVGDVHPEAVHTPVGPEAQGGAEVGADLLVVPVEVGLLGGEEVQIPLAVGHPGPGTAPEHRLPVGGREFAVRAASGAEDVTVPGGGPGTRPQRLLEPPVLVRGVVGDDVDDDLQPEPVRLGGHPVEVVERAQARVDIAVVGDVVAAVGEFGGIEGAQPYGVHTQRGEVGQALRDALQVTEPVAVGVGEAARVHLVDDGLAPPVRVTGGEVGHAGSLFLRAG